LNASLEVFLIWPPEDWQYRRDFAETFGNQVGYCVYRLGFASSRSEARQLVNHGHFTVNGRGVNIPSFHVKQGSIVKIKESSKRKKKFSDIENKMKNAERPGWLHFNFEDLIGKVLHEPSAKDVKTNFDAHIIVEYYSR
jgi:small subunit ribosomal protein S4